MKILFISSLYPTGTDSAQTDITRALHQWVRIWHQEPGVRVQVVRPVYLYLKELLFGEKRKTGGTQKSPRKKIFTLDNVPVVVYPVFKIPRIAYLYSPLYRFLDRYLKSTGFEPDIVVAHYDKSLHIGHRYASRRNLPLVSGLHIAPDLMADNPEAFTLRCGGILAASAAIACRSGYIYNKVTSWYPRCREKSFIAFSGIEEEIIDAPDAGNQRLDQWKENGRISVISVSSLIARKKIDTVLHALALLRGFSAGKTEGKADWTYTVIGDGEERPRLEALASQLGIRERVIFTGTLPRRQVIAKMKQSHIFILVSRLETFGLVYLEAMATGNIVIGSSGEGIDGIIRHGENGFLIPPGEVEPLAEILRQIVFDYPASRLEQVLVNAHETVTAATDTKAARNYLERLKEIVKRGEKGAGTGIPDPSN